MKIRIVEARDIGPHFYEYDSLELAIEVLMSWGRANLTAGPTGSVWKLFRGKWVPLNEWSMGAR